MGEKIIHEVCQDQTGKNAPACAIRWLPDVCAACSRAYQYPTTPHHNVSPKPKTNQTAVSITNLETNLQNAHGGSLKTYMSLSLLSEHVSTSTTRVDVVTTSFRVGHHVERHLVVGLHIAATERVVVG